MQFCAKVLLHTELFRFTFVGVTSPLTSFPITFQPVPPPVLFPLPVHALLCLSFRCQYLVPFLLSAARLSAHLVHISLNGVY